MKPIYRVFLAEDSEEIRTLVKRILGRCGIDVIAFEDGRECLDALLSGHCKLPDLLITDIHMPVMDGHALVKALRSDPRFDAMPILIHSSEAEVQDRCYDAQECAYNIRKPSAPSVLRAYVEELIGKESSSAPGQRAVISSATL